MPAVLRLYSGHKMTWHVSKELFTDKLFIKNRNCCRNYSLIYWPLLCCKWGKTEYMEHNERGTNKQCLWKIDPCCNICCIFRIIITLQEINSSIICISNHRPETHPVRLHIRTFKKVSDQFQIVFPVLCLILLLWEKQLQELHTSINDIWISICLLQQLSRVTL